MYSKTVLDHFRNPRNVGVIADADGVGEVGNPLCGDIMTIYLKVKNEHIEDIKFQTFGCGAAIAVSSMLTEIAKGKSIEDAKKLTNKNIAEALEGLPKQKLHCSNLGADALHLAIKAYEKRTTRKHRLKVPVKAEPKNSSHREKFFCPYCDIEIKAGTTFCDACQSNLEEEH
jgi:nitrogen fixation NifU-like protein